MKLKTWIALILLPLSCYAGETWVKNERCEELLNEVNPETHWDCDNQCTCCDHIVGCCVRALPGGPPLMPPFLADPRKVGMSAGWRFRDHAIDPHNTGPVSFGDYAGLVRFCNVMGCGGALDIGIEGAVWAVFRHCAETSPMVNADYYVAIPVTYAINCWAFRFRLFHISSHLGDEFLIMNPGFDRRNPSSEYVDLFAQYRPNCDFRVYGGIGWIARNDPTYEFHRFYSEYGAEYYLPFFRWCIPNSRVLGRVFTAAHFRSREDNHFKFDGTFTVGYEWARCFCDYKRIRLYFEYHNGFSLEGQFNRLPTDYTALIAYYGY